MSGIIKRATSLAAQSRVFEKFVNILEHADGQNAGLLRILTYHRVDEPAAHPWLNPGMISATPPAFREQMEFLAAHYNVVSVEDVLAALEHQGSKGLPPRAVLVTFDDAYCDFEQHAWPVLKHFRLPVTLFVPTAYPNHPERTFWWDDLYQAIYNNPHVDALVTPVGLLSLSNASRIQSYKRLVNYLKTLEHSEAVSEVKHYCNELGLRSGRNSVLSWNSLRRLAREGVTLGAHTRNHPLMNRISNEEARQEAVGSLQDLKREIGSALPIFAYPSGAFNEESVSILKQEGFMLAFTTKRGINHIRYADPLKLRRINVGGRTNLSILRAQLLPWTIHFNRLQAILTG